MGLIRVEPADTKKAPLSSASAVFERQFVWGCRQRELIFEFVCRKDCCIHVQSPILKKGGKMYLKHVASKSLLCLRIGLTSIALFQFVAGAALANAGQGDGRSSETRTPIKHVIVIIGENRSFDHVFATYQPKRRGIRLESSFRRYRQRRWYARSQLLQGATARGDGFRSRSVPTEPAQIPVPRQHLAVAAGRRSYNTIRRHHRRRGSRRRRIGVGLLPISRDRRDWLGQRALRTRGSLAIVRCPQGRSN